MKIDNYDNHPMSGGCISTLAFIVLSVLSVVLLVTAVI